MRTLVTPAEIYPALQALLGLPDHCVSFELSARAGKIVTVACEHYISLGPSGIKQLERVFSEYELVHKPAPAPAADEGDGAAEFRVVDFDAWMRDRTEGAHREFMDRTARALPCR